MADRQHPKGATSVYIHRLSSFSVDFFDEQKTISAHTLLDTIGARVPRLFAPFSGFPSVLRRELADGCSGQRCTPARIWSHTKTVQGVRRACGRRGVSVFDAREGHLKISKQPDVLIQRNIVLKPCAFCLWRSGNRLLKMGEATGSIPV